MNETQKISQKSHVEAVDDSLRQSGTLHDEETCELIDYLDDWKILSLQNDPDQIFQSKKP